MSARDRTLLGVVVLAAVLAGYWFLLLSPKRDEATALDARIATAQSAVTAARSEVARGRRAKQDFPQTYAELIKLGKAVPADDDVRSLLVQLDTTAGREGVDFRDIKVTSAGGVAPVTAAVPATQAAAALAPPGAVVGPAGLNTYPFTLAFRGSFSRLASFFAEIEAAVQADAATIVVSGRLLTIDALSLSPTQKGFPEVDVSVNATAFLVPPSEGLVAGATPQGPAATTPVPPTTVGQP